MKSALASLAFAALVCWSFAAEAPKRTLYLHVTREFDDLDKQVVAAFSARFNVVHLHDDTNPGYVQPKPTAGSLPHVARGKDGKLIGGDVLVAYVIAADGRVTEPTVLKTSDKRLNAEALKATESWRFTPATLNGAVIATIAAQNFHFHTPPTEFVTQVLEPTGGKIQRPKEWFYQEAHQGPKYTWILSKEDINAGRYETGVRIECFNNLKEGAGKTAKEFILDFVKSKKEGDAQILSTCDEKDQGLFTRICLETEEGPYRILYSLFWGNNIDVAVVSISGAPKELWEVYSPAFNKMSAFELIDMKRFEKDSEKK